jgi:shikimate kinase
MITMPVIYLVGFMGCGKSSVGAALAGLLGVRFVDLDQSLEEQLGASVAEIFARHGEEHFRREESRLLTEVTRLERAVVATGGGTFCSAANRRVIEDSGGISVYLEAEWPTLLARLPGRQTDRPKFGDPVSARRLFEARQPLYRLALLTVAVSPDAGPREVARSVAESLAGLGTPSLPGN